VFNLCASRSEWQDPSFAAAWKSVVSYAIQATRTRAGARPAGNLHFTTYSAADKAVHVCIVDVKESPFTHA